LAGFTQGEIQAKEKVVDGANILLQVVSIRMLITHLDIASSCASVP
jgi:hypothetical protein